MSRAYRVNAQYSQQCSHCGEDIRVGSPIIAEGTEWIHAECFMKAYATGPRGRGAGTLQEGQPRPLANREAHAPAD